MIMSGFEVEKLDATPTQICNFATCCAQHAFKTDGSLPCASEFYTGPDGRDLISLREPDFQNLLNIQSNLSSTLLEFVAWKLTAHLASQRCLYAIFFPRLLRDRYVEGWALMHV
jgi:hypothetical protein